MPAKLDRNQTTKYDPSRTATLRRRFAGEASTRFDNFRKKVVQLVDVDDAFGLGLPSMTGTVAPSLVGNVSPWQRFITNERYRFLTSQDKLEEFRKWLVEELENEVLTDPDLTADDWWQKYVEEGFKQGAGRAFDDTQKAKVKPENKVKLGWYEGSRDQFLRSSFANPVSKERIQLLSGRVFTELKGLTDETIKVLTRELADGMAKGLSPREVARNLVKQIEGMSKARAETIARTETIRAHAEGQLNSLESLGVEEIGVAVEWSATKHLDGSLEKRVCPLCRPMNGVVFSIKDAHGLIPRHPNCRCAFVPANVGEDEAKQKRTEATIRKALQRSVQLEGRKGTLEEQQKASSWVGADLVAKASPESILNALRLVANVFCATGSGGGVDPSCSKGGKGTPLPVGGSKSFTFDNSQEGAWSFGSGVVPFREKDGMSPSPFPSNTEYFQRRKPTHYNAKPDPVSMVNVKELTAWQTIVDTEKLRPITDLGSLGPIRVAKIGGRLTIQNGNHRAASAFIQGLSEIPAIITDFDKPGNSKYLKKPIEGFTGNVFCPTGEGGGVDPSCKPSGKKGMKDLIAEARKDSSCSVSGSGFCRPVAVRLWDLLGRPKDLTPHTVTVPDDPKTGEWGAPDHVLLYSKASKQVVDPTSEQWDRSLPNEGIQSDYPYFRYKELSTEDLQGVRDKYQIKSVENVFCPTGPGGGVNPTCSPGGAKKLLPKGFPDGIKGLKFLSGLGGSTGAKLMVDANGNKFVLKYGSSPNHLRAEYAAEEAYRAAGADMADSHVYETADGPAKLSRFVEGTLYKDLDPVAKETATNALREHYAVDVALANWDVMGKNFDNVMVEKGTGKVIRIDVGGSLDYRAQGASKGTDWNTKADEWESMKDPSMNKTSAAVFKGMSNWDAKESGVSLKANKQAIIDALPDKYKVVVSARIDATVQKSQIPTPTKAPPPKPTPPPPTPTVTAKPKMGGLLVKHLDSAQGAKAHGLADYLQSSGGLKETNFKELHVDKIKFLNPNGVVNGVFYMPDISTKGNQATNIKNAEALKKVLPPGTQVKVVVLTQGHTYSPDHTFHNGKVVKVEKVPGGFNPVAKTAGTTPSATPATPAAKASKSKAAPVPNPIPGHSGDDVIDFKGFSYAIKPKDQLPPTPPPTDLLGKLPTAPEVPDDYYSKVKLTYPEQTSVYEWKSSSRDIRKEWAKSPPPPSEKTTAGLFVKTISKLDPYEGTTYRGIQGAGAIALAEALAQLGPGTIWSDKAPMSTSRNVDTGIKFSGGDVLFRIKGKTGRSVQKVTKSHQGEQEITTMPGTQFKVLGVHQNLKSSEYYSPLIKHFIDLEEI